MCCMPTHCSRDWELSFEQDREGSYSHGVDFSVKDEKQLADKQGRYS